MHECFHCGQKTVIWDADFSFDDFSFDGDGIVHALHCTNCGAEIYYQVPLNSDEVE